MIYKKCVMTIANNTAKLDEDIYLYRLDKNIDLYFTIVNNKYKFNKSDMNNIITLTSAAYFQVRLYKNAQVKYIFAIQPTDNGDAILRITDDLIDEPIEAGDYDFQISLLDENKKSMVSMPIVSKQLHVCEPLVSEDALMGEAILGLSTVGEGEIKNAFDENGNYIREIHVNGQVITAELLNKFEEALETHDNAIKDQENNNTTKTTVENGKLYLLKSDGTKIDEGTELPTSIGPAGEQGPAGEKGQDGLTTSIKYKEQTYTQVDGEIDLSNVTFYDDSEIKQNITNIQNELGTEELTTTAKNIKAAINENSSQIKEIEKKAGNMINILDFEEYVVGDDWTVAFQKAIDLQEVNFGTIYVPSKGTPYKIGKLYIKEFLSITGDNNYWGSNIHHSLPINDSVVITTENTVINSKEGFESNSKKISITNLSFDSEKNGCTFFNDIKLDGSYIYNNRFRSYHVILYGGLTMVSTFEHNLFLNITKSLITYNNTNLTDSRIINNYINGSTSSNEVVMFDLVKPNQSLIQGNFVDFCKVGFKITNGSIGFSIDSNDIQLCSICFDLNYPSGLSITNNRIRWVNSTKTSYWTDRGADVSDYGIDNEWVVFKINNCHSLSVCNNFLSDIEVGFLFTSNAISNICSHGNMYDQYSTLIKNNMSYIGFDTPYGENINIDETKIITLNEQPTYLRDSDRMKYFKGWKCVINNVEYTNWDDGVLFKNPLGQYNVGEDLFTIPFNTDTTYNNTVVRDNEITVSHPADSDTTYYWVYTNPIRINQGKRYYIELFRDISFEYNVLIQIKYDGETEWKNVGLRSRHNEYQHILDDITANADLRIAIVGERGKVISVKKPVVKEIL